MLVEVVIPYIYFGIHFLYLLQAILISICTINIYDNCEKSRRFQIFKITQYVDEMMNWWNLEPGQKHRGHVPLGRSRLGGEEFQHFAIYQVVTI